VYSREIDGQVLTMTTSGFTYYRQHVLFDHESESFWFHLPDTNDLTCIAGLLADRILPGIKFIDGPWDYWNDLHPDSKYMKSGIR
jgi:hypothetical protein